MACRLAAGLCPDLLGEPKHSPEPSRGWGRGGNKGREGMGELEKKAGSEGMRREGEPANPHKFSKSGAYGLL